MALCLIKFVGWCSRLNKRGTNYYDKIVGEQDTTVAGTNKDFTTRRLATQAASILRPDGVDVNMSYNWPYDFFASELVKIVTKSPCLILMRY